MDYNRAGVFVRVVRAGGFTAASRQLDLPKSSLSRSVARLERDLGVRLLHRTARTMTLTEVGRAYFEAINPAYASLDDAELAAQVRETDPSGVVRLTAPPDLTVLAQVLADFSRAYPRIRLEVVLTGRTVDLIGEGIDLAVRAGTLTDSSLVARRIGLTELAVMAAPAYLRRAGRPTQIDELVGHSWVLLRAIGGRSPVRLTGPDGERMIDVAAAIIADDLAFCRSMVEAGAGLALLPCHHVADAVALGRLEQVLPGWVYRGASLFVVLPSARLVPARVALLRDYLVAHLGRRLVAAEQQLAGAVPARRRGRPRLDPRAADQGRRRPTTTPKPPPRSARVAPR